VVDAKVIVLVDIIIPALRLVSFCCMIKTYITSYRGIGLGISMDGDFIRFLQSMLRKQSTRPSMNEFTFLIIAVFNVRHLLSAPITVYVGALMAEPHHQLQVRFVCVCVQRWMRKMDVSVHTVFRFLSEKEDIKTPMRIFGQSIPEKKSNFESKFFQLRRLADSE
jgi:hypothetical protein